LEGFSSLNKILPRTTTTQLLHYFSKIHNQNKIMSQCSEGKLTCEHVLHPPMRTFGGGSATLQYATGSTAWQCTFSMDGQWLAACFGSPDVCIHVWKRIRPAQGEKKEESWQLVNTISGIHERTIRSIAFAPVLSPLILASASFDGTVCVWEYSETLQDFECSAQLEGHENEVKCVTWNSTGSLLATCSRDKSVWIWECFLPGTVGGPDIASGPGGDFDCIAVLNGHQGDVKAVRFAPSNGQWGDGDEILLSASYDDTIKCWAEDAGDWYCAASLSNVHSSTIWSLAVAPGGGRLVSGSSDGSLAIFKCYTEAEKNSKFPDENSERYDTVYSLFVLMKSLFCGVLIGSHISERFVPSAMDYGNVLGNCQMLIHHQYTMWTTRLPRLGMGVLFHLAVTIEYKFTKRLLKVLPIIRCSLWM
jgi:hypothetical protein